MERNDKAQNPKAKAAPAARGSGRPEDDLPRIFKRPGYKNYQFYYRQQVLSARTDDRREAERYAAAYKARHDAREAGVVYRGDATVGDALDFFVEWTTSNGARDAGKNRTHAAALRPYFGPIRIVDLHPVDDGASFAAARRRSVAPRTLGDGTIRTYVTTLNKALDAYRGAHPSALMPKVHVPGPKKGRPKEVWLTRNEVARLCRAARGRVWDRAAGAWKRHAPAVEGGVGRLVLRSARWRALRRPLLRLIVLGVYSASRREVLFNLGWTPHRTHGHVEVDHPNCLIYRAGSDHTETSKGRAETALPPPAHVLLALWRRNDALPRDPVTRRARRPVETIVNQDGRRPSPNTMLARWNSLLAGAAFEVRVTLHTLRHTCATWLIEGGAPIEDAAWHLDVTIEVFESTYLQVSPQFAAEAALAMDPAWWRRAVSLRAAAAQARPAAAPEGDPPRPG